MSELITSSYQMNGIYRAKLITSTDGVTRAYIPGISNNNIFKKNETTGVDELDEELFNKLKSSFPPISWCVYTEDAKVSNVEGGLAWVMFENSNIEHPVVINYIYDSDRTTIVNTTIDVSDNTFNNVFISDNSCLPVPTGYTITSDYNEIQSSGKIHKGIDFAMSGKPPIYAAFDGEIYYSGWDSNSGYGNYVEIISKINGFTFSVYYAHMSSLTYKGDNDNNYYRGTEVHCGDVIGYMGSTGNSSGDHLHFEMRQWSGTKRADGRIEVNPWNYLPK